MKSNIYIPKSITVGFNNRKDTYTGKLAFIVYHDDKGVLRQEKSWEGWRDKNIEPEKFDNVPTEGFVLNKKVGGDRYGWNPRQTYTRVYDPRGFEFEIVVPNLLYILENTSSIKGKGLEGKFVYGWDGKNLVLVPVDAPEYKDMQEFSNLQKLNKITKKNLKVGWKYLTQKNDVVTYMGFYKKYSPYFVHSNYNPNKNVEETHWFYHNANEGFYTIRTLNVVQELEQDLQFSDLYENMQSNKYFSKVVNLHLEKINFDEYIKDNNNIYLKFIQYKEGQLLYIVYNFHYSDLNVEYYSNDKFWINTKWQYFNSWLNLKSNTLIDKDYFYILKLELENGKIITYQ